MSVKQVRSIKPPQSWNQYRGHDLLFFNGTWNSASQWTKPVATLKKSQDLSLKDLSCSLKRKVPKIVGMWFAKFPSRWIKSIPLTAFSFWWAHNISNCLSTMLTLSELIKALRVGSCWNQRCVCLAYPGQRSWSGRTVFFHQSTDQTATHLVFAACFHSQWLWKHPWCRNKSQTHSCPCNKKEINACIYLVFQWPNEAAAGLLYIDQNCDLHLKEQPGGVARRPQLWTSLHSI